MPKKDFKGEVARTISGTVNSPKTTPNHGSITNAGTSSKEEGLRNIAGSATPDPKK